jgi:cytochrome oxidase Cu insertion factor (SCO1/SenC/PrrC family)
MRRSLLMSFGLFLAGCSWSQSHKPTAAPTSFSQVAEVGQVAPDLDGDDISGKPLRLADYRGKVVVLNFWASA